MSEPTPRWQVVDCSKPLDHPKRETSKPYTKAQLAQLKRDQKAALLEEQKKLRQARNVALAASDWVELPSARERLSPEKMVEWETYRQALRDLPATGGDLPEPPCG